MAPLELNPHDQRGQPLNNLRTVQWDPERSWNFLTSVANLFVLKISYHIFKQLSGVSSPVKNLLILSGMSFNAGFLLYPCWPQRYNTWLRAAQCCPFPHGQFNFWSAGASSLQNPPLEGRNDWQGSLLSSEPLKSGTQVELMHGGVRQHQPSYM